MDPSFVRPSGAVWDAACHRSVAVAAVAGLGRRCRDGAACTISLMAGYRALAAVGRSIVALLERRFQEQLPNQRRPEPVMATTADFDRVNTTNAVIRFPAVSVYCYRLSVDPETRPGWSAVASFDGVPRLPLRMHLLISAWDEVAEAELEWLGLAARVLESESILSGPLLHPSGQWAPGDAVQIVQDDLGLISMSEAFQALTTDYRLCIPYVARVVRIDGAPQPPAERVTTVLAGTEDVAP
jgi:uncharacterized protein DUF4255